MAFHVSLVGRTDLSGEIYRQIRQAILDGRLRSGERLSPTRELAAALRVSRSTVTVAYESLLAEGFATSHTGAGTFVSHQLEAKRPASKTRRSVRAIRVRGVWETISPPTVFVRARFDFRTGLPDASLFPHRAWRRVVARALRSHEIAAGVYENSAGDWDLRAAIARHIGISRSISGSPNDVIVTNGTQQALDIIARVLLEPGDVVAVEKPGYLPPKYLFKALGRARDRCAGRQGRPRRGGAAGRGQGRLRDAVASVSPRRGNEPVASTRAAYLGRAPPRGCR